MDSTTNPATPSPSAALTQQGRNIISNVRSFTGQPALRRAIPAMVVAVAAIVGLIIYTILGEPPRTALHSGLEENEKHKAMEILSSNNIDVTLDERTGTLRVLTEQYHKARMILASEGMPQGIPDGYENLTSMPMGTSRSVESARLRQTQELELARSIASLQTVQTARVHLALPEKTAFVRETDPPRASVFLQIRPGSTIDEGQVRAIVSLVATSVPGMMRNHVSVVDQTGRLLSGSMNDPMQIINDQQMQHRVRLEALYRQRIEKLITPIVGVGNAAVEVTVDMDFTQSEVTSEQYAPEDSALRSEQRSISQNNVPEAMGIPGAVSNTPPNEAQLEQAAPEGQGGTQNTMSGSSSETKNYEVSRRVETHRPTSAVVTRVHAAVLLRAQADPNSLAVEEGPATRPQLPKEVMDDVERIVRTVIGYDEGRGDAVTVSSQPFIEGFDVPDLSFYEQPWVRDIARIASQLLALAIVVMGVVRPILTRVLTADAEAGMIDPNSEETIEVAEGDSLDDLRAKLGLDDDLSLDEEASYENKVASLRQIAQNDAGRLVSIFEMMLTDKVEEEE